MNRSGWRVLTAGLIILSICALSEKIVGTGFAFAQNANEINNLHEPAIQIDINHPKDGGIEKNYSVPVKGKVVSTSPIELLIVQGAQLELPRYNSAGGIRMQIEFDRNVSVQKGTNIIEVSAKNIEGHGVRKRVTIEADPPDSDLPEQFNMCIAIMSFGDEYAKLDGNLIGAVFDTKRFRVLDRANVDSVLQELKIGASDLAASETSLQLGKLQIAQIVLRPKIARSDSKLEVQIDVISTETGRIIDQLDAQIMNPDSEDDVSYAMKRLASGVAQKFPRVTGVVTKVFDPESFIISVGSGEKVSANMIVLVFTRGEPVKDDITGEILQPGALTMLGQGIVENVTRSGATCRRIHFKDEAVNLEAGFQVMTW
jgi:hypothetical protein